MGISLRQNAFISATQKRADAYAAWSGNSLVYEYYGGAKQRILEHLIAKVEAAGFSGWRTDLPNRFYHRNDGRGHGGGFSGFCVHYGTMPLLVSLRFYNAGVGIAIYRPDYSSGGVYTGAMIFEAECLDPNTYKEGWQYWEETHFENILK